jgi:hypothetical protein
MFFISLCSFSKAEVGTMDEIANRWAEELHWRQAREARTKVIWYHQLNLFQNRFRSFWHQSRKYDPKSTQPDVPSSCLVHSFCFLFVERP